MTVSSGGTDAASVYQNAQQGPKPRASRREGPCGRLQFRGPGHRMAPAGPGISPHGTARNQRVRAGSQPDAETASMRAGAGWIAVDGPGPRGRERGGGPGAPGGRVCPRRRDDHRTKAARATGRCQIYVTAPGGTTAGWTVGGGVFVARHLSVEGEWSWSGVMTAREPARYGMTYIEERRDRMLGGMVRIHIRPGRRIDIEPVAGVAAVAHDRWSTTETNRPWLPPDQAVEVGPRIRYDTRDGGRVHRRGRPAHRKRPRRSRARIQGPCRDTRRGPRGVPIPAGSRDGP